MTFNADRTVSGNIKAMLAHAKEQRKVEELKGVTPQDLKDLDFFVGYFGRKLPEMVALEDEMATVTFRRGVSGGV